MKDGKGAYFLSKPGAAREHIMAREPTRWLREGWVPGSHFQILSAFPCSRIIITFSASSSSWRTSPPKKKPSTTLSMSRKALPLCPPQPTPSTPSLPRSFATGWTCAWSQPLAPCTVSLWWTARTSPTLP